MAHPCPACGKPRAGTGLGCACGWEPRGESTVVTAMSDDPRLPPIDPPAATPVAAASASSTRPGNAISRWFRRRR